MKLTKQHVSTALKRVITRPLPLVLSYGFSLIAALVLAPMLTVALRSSFRRPLMVEAINSRSLDLLLDVQMAPIEGGSPIVTWLGLILLPLAFIVMWVLRIMIEGGALHTYNSAERVSFGDYVKAGLRWTLPFFGQGILSSGIYAVCFVTPAMISWFTRNYGGVVDLISTALTLVFVAIACLWTVFAEMARAYGVVEQKRNIAASLLEIVSLVKRAPLRVFAWYALCAAGSFGLILLSMVFNRTVPVQWWLLNLLVLQGITLLRLGVRSLRWSVNVTWMQAGKVQDQSSKGIS